MGVWPIHVLFGLSHPTSDSVRVSLHSYCHRRGQVSHNEDCGQTVYINKSSVEAYLHVSCISRTYMCPIMHHPISKREKVRGFQLDALIQTYLVTLLHTHKCKKQYCG